MQSENEHMDDIFRQKLGKRTAFVDPKVRNILKRRLIWQKFLSFSWQHFNVYYAAVGIVSLGIIGFSLIWDKKGQEIEEVIKVIEERQIPFSDDVNKNDINQKKQQLRKKAINHISEIDSKSDGYHSAQADSGDYFYDNKQSLIPEQINTNATNISINEKQVQQDKRGRAVDTVISVDTTILKGKTKVRLRWK